MKIVKNTSYDIIYSIEYFEPTEGGMDSDKFGDDCTEIEDAIHLLEIAKNTKRNVDWKIVCTVTVENKIK